MNGGRTPADAAQPHMKETITSIQTRLDQLYNRTQVHDQTLHNINNHLVNGNELDGVAKGGGVCVWVEVCVCVCVRGNSTVKH